MAVPNRIMMTVHGTRLSPRRFHRYLEERVRGGVGLVGLSAMIGLYDFPFGPGRFFPPYAGDEDAVPPNPLSPEGIVHYDRSIASLQAQAEVIQRNGGKCVGQLYHPGASRHIDGSHESFQPATAPSNVPDEFRRNMPHALTVAEIAAIVAAFGQSARRAAEAGLDGVELHGAHGYLINEFLSPYNNHRTDDYGGDLDNRMRFLLEVVSSIRTATRSDYPIGIRINGSDLVGGGLTNDDMQEIARRCQQAGLVYISVSGGTFGGLREGTARPYVTPAYSGDTVNVDDAAGIKRAVSIPVMVAGRIVDLDTAERIVAGGGADMIGLTRALIADPMIVAKSFAGRANEVTPCIGCNECHYGRPTSCAVNSAAGREEEFDIEPVAEPRRVLVVGAGPAGMECARVAALRGHAVTVLDRRSHVGGLLAVLATDPPRAEFGRYIDHLHRALQAASVDISLGVDGTPDVVDAHSPDVVVLATGAVQHRPPVHGGDAAHVVIAEDVFSGAVDLGQRVVVVGGIEDHLPPLTTADLIARTGRQVTIISELFHPGQRIEAGTLHVLTARLLASGVRLVALTGLVAVHDGAIEVRNSLTNQRSMMTEVDSVVLATMRHPFDPLSAALRASGHDVRLIGDCLSPRRLLHATTDGARAAMAI